MTDVKKPNPITPTENKNGAEDMNRKVSFKRKKVKKCFIGDTDIGDKVMLATL